MQSLEAISAIVFSYRKTSGGRGRNGSPPLSFVFAFRLSFAFVWYLLSFFSFWKMIGGGGGNGTLLHLRFDSSKNGIRHRHQTLHTRFLTLVLMEWLLRTPFRFSRKVKNVGVQRCRFSRNLSVILSAPFLNILSPGHLRSGHQVRSSERTS